MTYSLSQRIQIWTNFGLQAGIARLPPRIQLSAGRRLGERLLRRQSNRRAIAEANIAFCFPELSAESRQALLNAHAQALGEGIAEAGIAWHSSKERLLALTDIEGLDAVHAAHQRGHGVLLLSGHFTNLEMSVQSIAARIDAHGIWRPLGRAVTDAMTHKGRMNHLQGLVEKSDFRAALRHLRRGGILTMAFDQADSTQSAVTAPFFGHPASCIDTPARLAKSLGCAVFLFHTERVERRYRTVISDEQLGLGSVEPAVAAAQLNAALERQVLKQPERYYWVHRRFKHTHPELYV